MVNFIKKLLKRENEKEVIFIMEGLDAIVTCVNISNTNVWKVYFLNFFVNRCIGKIETDLEPTYDQVGNLISGVI